jgi:N-acetylneuraminate synthase
MNDIASITPSVEILRSAGVPFALLHCVSIYPTPYDRVRLGAMTELARRFPDALVGLSDHSLGIYTALAAVALGATVLEKHFTSDKSWPGPDVPISLDPEELKQLVEGSNAVWRALGGAKDIQPEEAPTIAFAYASVVAIRPIARGDRFTRENLWVKRPGTGRFLAKDYEMLLGREAARDVPANAQLSDADVVA